LVAGVQPTLPGGGVRSYPLSLLRLSILTMRSSSFIVLACVDGNVYGIRTQTLTEKMRELSLQRMVVCLYPLALLFVPSGRYSKFFVIVASLYRNISSESFT